MRLVEILAREMAEWPEDDEYKEIICITQDYTGTSTWEYPNPVFNGQEWVYAADLPVDCLCLSELAEDHATALVTREMWEAERAKLNRAVEWGGEGLPPSGTDIEYLSYLGKWKKGRYLGEFGGRSVCGDYETGAVGYVEGIRPMCTAELIAAEERERVLDDIYRIIRNAGRPGNKADMAEALYDAGYRKQEKDQ